MDGRFEHFTYAIFEITRCWHKLASQEMAKYELKGTHAVYLTTLYKHKDGLTAPQLCELCGKDKSDVSRMMSIMEKKGLVTKEGTGKNLYRGLLKLTEEGVKAARKVAQRARLAVENGGNGLSDENRKVFYETLDLIVRNMQALCEEGIPAEQEKTI